MPVPQYVLAEAVRGLANRSPVANMLAEARQYHAIVSRAWMPAPGLALAPILLGYLLLAWRWRSGSPGKSLAPLRG